MSVSDYLAGQGAALVTVERAYAISVHGELAVGELRLPYHLVPDDGFLGKISKWQRLPAVDRLALVQSRWNPEARERLEAQLRDCADNVLAIAGAQGLSQATALLALQALQAKYELARQRCSVAVERVAASRGQKASQIQAEQTRHAVNLSRYPESFTLAASLRRQFIAVLGPTNSGKTHVAMEQLARAETGVYLAPLRLLALENYNRLRSAGLSVSLVTGEQRKLHPDATHVASTVEMLDTRRRVQVAVIDEIQLLDDPDRGAAWTAAVCGVPADTVYLLGAPEAQPAIESLVGRVGGTLEVRKLERMSPLYMEKQPLGSLRHLQPGDMLIAFSRRDVLYYRDLVVKQGLSVSTIYGNLSPEVRQAQAERFVQGETQVVVATDAVGMGLNTPARRVIFTTAIKFDGDAECEIPAALAKQIAGRAGRFGEHEAGLVAGIDAVTHRTIAALLRQRPEALPGSGFFVSPNLDYLQQISDATGENKLYNLLQLFVKHINVHDEFFLPSHLQDQLAYARWLDNLELSLADRFTLSLCPISKKVIMLEQALRAWAQARARNQSVRLPPPHLLPRSSDYDELQFYEDSCKLYAAYAWLGYRLPDTFPDGEAAQEGMQSTSARIDAILQAETYRPRRRRG